MERAAIIGGSLTVLLERHCSRVFANYAWHIAQDPNRRNCQLLTHTTSEVGFHIEDFLHSPYVALLA